MPYKVGNSIGQIKYWIGWFMLFFLREIPAVLNPEDSGTLSESVWTIKNLRPWTKAVLGPVLFLFCLDLGFHFWLETPLWPF